MRSRVQRRSYQHTVFSVSECGERWDNSQESPDTSAPKVVPFYMARSPDWTSRHVSTRQRLRGSHCLYGGGEVALKTVHFLPFMHHFCIAYTQSSQTHKIPVSCRAWTLVKTKLLRSILVPMKIARKLVLYIPKCHDCQHNRIKGTSWIAFGYGE